MAAHSSFVRWGWIVVAGIWAILLTIHLPTSPIAWFDEGLNTATAATLARTGLYALPDSAGARVFDPAIQTGPPVLFPLAGVFWLFGTGMLQARLLMVLFAIGTLLVYRAVAMRLVGQWGALVALFILLCGTGNEYTSFLPLARQVLGEVAALGLLMWGHLRWADALEQHVPRRKLLAVGLAFGLAMLIKSQVLVVLPVAWAALLVADRVYYRRAGWLAFIVPGLVFVGYVGVWQAAQRLLIDPELAARNSAVLAQGIRIHILTFRLENMQNALAGLWQSGFALWGLPGLGYGIWLARKRTNFAHVGLLIFSLTWLGWYIGCSIGWPRYIFVGTAVLPIWTGGLLVALTRGRRVAFVPLWARVCAAVALVATLAGLFGVAHVRTILGPQQYDMERLVTYMQATIPASAVVETWEWNLDMLLPQRLHHPTTPDVNTVTRHLISGDDVTLSYNTLQANPDYIIDGPFSGWTGVYKATLRGENVRQVFASGTYALYEVQR